MIDSNKLKTIIEAEIDDSLGFLETDTTDERQKALEYYLREPYGNEVEGKSTIVTGEVAEVVDGALPQLMRVFTSADAVVEFQPVNDGDEKLAITGAVFPEGSIHDYRMQIGARRICID